MHWYCESKAVDAARAAKEVLHGTPLYKGAVAGAWRCDFPIEIGNIPRCGAGEGNRTLVCSLGSCRSAIELHPHFATFFLLDFLV